MWECAGRWWWGGCDGGGGGGGLVAALAAGKVCVVVPRSARILLFPSAIFALTAGRRRRGLGLGTGVGIGDWGRAFRAGV